MSRPSIDLVSNDEQSPPVSHLPIPRWAAMAALLLAVNLVGCARPVIEEPTTSTGSPPPGSYQLTCADATLNDDDVLTATCQKISGSFQATSLSDVEACLASIVNRGDIGNVDGNLICIPDLPATNAGIEFPEAETTINRWIYQDEEEEIYDHGWGIWAGLTQFVGEVDATPVRAFETWATPDNMIFRIENGQKAQQKAAPQRRLDLMHPRQLTNRAAVTAKATGDGDTNIFVSVAYNPPAADHAISNKLFLQSTLNTYLANGYTDIPDFPNNSITIKPVYKVIPANVPDGIYTMPGWPGTPVPAKTFPESSWNACVYVDINGSGTGGSSIDVGCGNRNADNTFYLNNFIHNTVSAADASYLSEQLGVTISAGDFAILVGMHVTSREILRWTWQTYWWSADPSAPETPSSSTIAAARPLPALDEAAAHYGMATAYQMVAPAQPVNGGQNIGASVIGYNPHLEAGFDPATFQVFRTINAGDPGHEITNRYGVETNCMTCHGFAFYDPTVDYSNGGNREKPYAPDFYLARDDSLLTGKLQLDFAWSILGSLVLDDE